MSGAHTPGPWISVGARIEHADDGVIDIADFDPCCMGMCQDGRGHAEIRANARLCAAAPDLLEALQDLFIDCMACDYNDGFNTSPLAKKVRAAIAKATGGAA